MYTELKKTLYKKRTRISPEVFANQQRIAAARKPIPIIKNEIPDMTSFWNAYGEQQ